MLVRQAVEGAVRPLGADGRVVDDIKLAVTEACSNVVRYAYREGTGPIHAGVTGGDGVVVVTIADEGTWLEPPTDDENRQGGLGIPLMRAVTRSCDISSDEGGTHVRLEFDLDPSDLQDGS